MSFLRNLQPVAMTGRMLKFVGDRLDSAQAADTSISQVAMSYWSALDVTGSYLRKQARRLRPGRIVAMVRRRPAGLEPVQNRRAVNRFPLYAPVSLLSLLTVPLIRQARSKRKPLSKPARGQSKSRVVPAASSSLRIFHPVQMMGNLVSGALQLLPGRNLLLN